MMAKDDQKWHVWDYRTYLHIFISATMNTKTYRDEDLEPYVKFFRVAISNNFFLMDDNFHPHCGRLVTLV